MKKIGALMISLLFLVCLVSSVSAYTISGTVNDTDGVGIDHAHVTGNITGNTYTNATGYYIFTAANGTHNITATKSGYYDNSTVKAVNGANVSDADIILEKKAIFADMIDTLNALVDIFPPVVLLVIAIVPVLILIAIVSFVLGLFGSILSGITNAFRGLK